MARGTGIAALAAAAAGASFSVAGFRVGRAALALAMHAALAGDRIGTVMTVAVSVPVFAFLSPSIRLGHGILAVVALVARALPVLGSLLNPAGVSIAGERPHRSQTGRRRQRTAEALPASSGIASVGELAAHCPQYRRNSDSETTTRRAGFQAAAARGRRRVTMMGYPARDTCAMPRSCTVQPGSFQRAAHEKSLLRISCATSPESWTASPGCPIREVTPVFRPGLQFAAGACFCRGLDASRIDPPCRASPKRSCSSSREPTEAPPRSAGWPSTVRTQGAALIGLVFAGRIGTGPETLFVVDPTSAGSPVTDPVLARIATHEEVAGARGRIAARSTAARCGGMSGRISSARRSRTTTPSHATRRQSVSRKPAGRLGASSRTATWRRAVPGSSCCARLGTSPGRSLARSRTSSAASRALPTRPDRSSPRSLVSVAGQAAAPSRADAERRGPFVRSVMRLGTSAPGHRPGWPGDRGPGPGSRILPTVRQRRRLDGGQRRDRSWQRAGVFDGVSAILPLGPRQNAFNHPPGMQALRESCRCSHGCDVTVTRERPGAASSERCQEP